jgi:hypothetical protein
VTIYGKKVSSCRLSLAAAFTAVLVAGFITASTIRPAEAAVITQEEHWRYNVYWYWDTDERETVGLITPIAVIENETSDRLEGYVADANGTRLDMYDGEQVVKVKYGYDEGMSTDWSLSGWIHDGYFAIDIPERYRDSDYIGLYIGNNDYSVDDGDINTQNANVFINSIRMDYRLGTNLQAVDVPTATAEIEQVVETPPMPGSLIDQILSMYGML